MINWCQLPSENSLLPIFPSAFLPNVEYFRQIKRFESVSIEGFETFPKQTLRNRTHIYSANGPLMMNIPIVKEKGIRQISSEVRICYKEHWNQKAYRAIESAYGRSPYFEYYKDDIEIFFQNNYERLIDLNTDILCYFKKKLKIETKIFRTNEYILPNQKELDFREVLSTNIKKESQDYEEYFQCFSDKHGFIPNLSVIDILFNLGHQAKDYI